MASATRRTPTGILRRRIRQVAAVTVLVAVVLAIADAGVGCYYAAQINSDGLQVRHEPPELDLHVETAGQDRITLRADKDRANLEHQSYWGVETPTGYGRAGRIISQSGRLVTREFQALEGTVTAGQPARLDRHAFPGDPQRALGVAFQEVTFDSPLGGMPAWYVAGRTDTWVIFVHGMGGKRSEALRALRPVVDSGAHALVITYRNDEGNPADPSGRHQYGKTEWQDVEAAAHFARGRGARDLVIVGYSMGGGIAMSFMRHSLLASEVDALVLDSPMLDFDATVDFAGKRRNLPGVVTATAKVFAAWRYGVDWGALDYLRDADRLKTPILLIQGTGDEKVPLSTSERLAELRGDIVQLEVFEGAQHVGAWNMGPERYEREVRDLLAKVMTPH
jgi:hypothetical protein